MSNRGIALVAATVSALTGLVLSARAEDRRTDKSQLVIMTFNAEFLFDGDGNEGQADFPWKGAPDEARAHMQRIAAVISLANPDIINLVEVENLNALTMLNSFLPGRGYQPYLDEGRDTYTGQDVGLLTRVDPEGGKVTYDSRVGQSGAVHKSCSKDYSAQFEVGDQKIALVGLHLLAIPDAGSQRQQREAQADAINGIARDQAAAGFQVIVLGDFNDYDGAADYLDHIDSTPISSVLSTIRRMDPTDPADDLVNACRFVPKSQRYTAFWDKNQNETVDAPGELTSINHVLLAPTLIPKVETVQFVHGHDPRVVSDHFPIVLHLRFGPPVPPAPPSGDGVRIVELLPNPPGDERQEESVTLMNSGSETVSLAGWKLRDRADTVWELNGDGALAAGARKEIKRQGRPMALNNDGDTLELVNPSGVAVQTVTYGKCAEGEEVSVQ